MRCLVPQPLLHLVSRPFRGRSTPNFVASTSRVLSPRPIPIVANRSRGKSSVSLPSSCHPTTALRPVSLPFRRRLRRHVVQTTAGIVPAGRATPHATPTTDTATTTQVPSSCPRLESRLVAPPPHVRSLPRVEETTSSIRATSRAIARANRTTEKRLSSRTVPQFPEPRSRRALPPPPSLMRALRTTNVRPKS